MVVAGEEEAGDNVMSVTEETGIISFLPGTSPLGSVVSLSS